MKSLRVVCFCFAFLCATFVAQLSAQHAEAGKKPPLKLTKAAVYSSDGSYSTGVAAGDLNGDGIPDMVVSNMCAGGTFCSSDYIATVGVLLGHGDGTFNAAVSYDSGDDRLCRPFSVAIADVNGDGHPDLVLAMSCQFAGQFVDNDQVNVLLGHGDGTFAFAAKYSAAGFLAGSVATQDLNGDGHPDIVVVSGCQTLDHAGNCFGSSDGSVSVLMNKGDGTFLPAAGYDSGGHVATSLAVGDVNGDGKLDLVVGNTYGCSNCGYAGASVLLGKGDGTFGPAVPYAAGGWLGAAVAIGDVNGDGKQDLVVATRCQTNYCDTSGAVGVLLGKGDGTFQSAVSYGTAGSEADSVAVADLNGDGKPDLVVADFCLKATGQCRNNHPGGMGILIGNGDGTFQAPIRYSSGGENAIAVTLADVNADNRADVVVANQCPTGPCGNGTVGVLLNALTVGTKAMVKSSPNPSQVNQSVTFTAVITSSSAVPDGEVVTFYNGTSMLGPGTTKNNGVATLTTSFAAAGAYTVEASYPGDALHTASSATVKQMVNH